MKKRKEGVMITDEMKAEIIRLLDEGKYKKEVAAILGISGASVSRNSPPTKNSAISDEQKAEIVRLYKSGKTQVQVSQIMNLSQGCVNYHLSDVAKRKRPKKAKQVFFRVQVSEPKERKPKTAKSNRHDENKKLWFDGLSKSKVAQRLGMGYSTVDNAIMVMGIESDQEKAKMKAIDRISGTIKVRLDHRTEVYFPPCDNLEERILKKKIQLGIIKE